MKTCAAKLPPTLFGPEKARTYPPDLREADGTNGKASSSITSQIIVRCHLQINGLPWG